MFQGRMAARIRITWLTAERGEDGENTSVLSELTLILKCNFIFSFVGFAKAVIHTGTTMKKGANKWLHYQLQY